MIKQDLVLHCTLACRSIEYLSTEQTPIKSIMFPWDFMSYYMTWHDNINIPELLCQKCLHGPVWLSRGGAFCSFWWSWRITSFAHCFQRISEGGTSSHVGFAWIVWDFPSCFCCVRLCLTKYISCTVYMGFLHSNKSLFLDILAEVLQVCANKLQDAGTEDEKACHESWESC